MAVWVAGGRVIYIRDLGLWLLCAAAGHAVDTSVARGKWVFFFLVSVGGLGQNISKAIKILLTSSLVGKYDVIKPFLLSFQVKIRGV